MTWKVWDEFPMMVFPKVSFGEFPQLQKIWAWTGVWFSFIETCTLGTKKALRVKALRNLIWECFLHICPMLLLKAHICLEQVAQQGSLLTPHSLHGLRFIAFHLHSNRVQEEAGSGASGDALLVPSGKRWVWGEEKDFRAVSRKQG